MRCSGISGPTAGQAEDARMKTNGTGKKTKCFSSPAKKTSSAKSAGAT